MRQKRRIFDPLSYAGKLQAAAADIRRNLPGSTETVRLAQRLDHHANAILSPDRALPNEETLVLRAMRHLRA